MRVLVACEFSHIVKANSRSACQSFISSSLQLPSLRFPSTSLGALLCSAFLALPSSGESSLHLWQHHTLGSELHDRAS